MENSMLVSVIIPVYNAEKVLPGCIDSVLNQSYGNLEIILINDGSTDHTGSLCDRYKTMDNRVKVCHQNNAGPSAARNNGIKVAQGTYLMFVDADDHVDTTIVQRLVDAIETNNAGLAVCTYKSHLFSNGKEVATGSFQVESVTISTEQFLSLDKFDMENAQAVRARAHVAGNVWGRLYVLDTIKSNGLLFNTKLTRYEDISFNICYLGYINDIFVSNKELYHYCVNSDQSSLSDRVTKDKFDMLVSSYDAVLHGLGDRKIDYIKYYYSYIIMGCIIRLFQDTSPFSFREAFHEVKTICSSGAYKDAMRYYHIAKGGSTLIPFLLERKLFLLASLAAKMRMLEASWGNKPIRQWCFSSKSE